MKEFKASSGAGFKGSGAGFKPSEKVKPLQTMPPAPDPLAEAESSGDLEADTKQQLNMIEKGFQDRAKEERERFLAATETGFYFVAVFDSNAQCDTFIQATGLDKGQSDLFVDGRVLAKFMGIELPDPVIKFDRKFKVDKKLLALTMKEPEK